MHFSPDGSNLITSSDDDQVFFAKKKDFSNETGRVIFNVLMKIDAIVFRLLCMTAKEDFLGAPLIQKSMGSI